jgi:transcriptional regulator with XRE-family HTH domain
VTAVVAAFHRRAEVERTRLGMTKMALCAKASISRVTYDRLATQPMLPLARTVTSLADALGMDKDEALTLAGLIDAPTPAQVAEQRVRAAMVEALRHRLPDVDPAILARVALNMGDILHGLANELYDAAGEDEP